MPLGIVPLSRSAKRRARPWASISTTPGGSLGSIAYTVSALNEQAVPSTVSFEASAMYGSGPWAVE
jgi:hypothetical protein